MRNIRKGKEPEDLAQCRKDGGSIYEHFTGTNALCAQLVREQFGICCYCMGPISTTKGTATVEHWSPRNPHPSVEGPHQLDYWNMLAVCRGLSTEADPEGRRTTGLPKDQKHCDRQKEQQYLSRNPANPVHAVEDVISYDSQGYIYSPTDEIFNGELESVLNLNTPFLRRQRRAIYDALESAIQMMPSLDIEDQIHGWNNPQPGGDLRSYCQVAVFFLKLRLATPSSDRI